MQNQQLLFFIAKKAGVGGAFSSSTAKIAFEMSLSQQSVSRKLRELKKQGLIELNASPKGIEAKLTASAVAEIKKHFLDLKQLFDAKQVKSIEGRLKIGLGEGAYYVSQKGYSKQFKKLIGFTPFPGTLNLIVDEEKLSFFLLDLKPLKIRGFKTAKRSFGKITAYPIAIEKNLEGAVLFPERSSHPPTEVEVISPHFLRKKLKLKEGDWVRVFHSGAR